MALSPTRRRTLLEKAAQTLRPVRITYAKPDGTIETRTIEIDDFATSKAGDVYFDAYCRLRKEVRRFRLDRILRHRTLASSGYQAVLG